MRERLLTQSERIVRWRYENLNALSLLGEMALDQICEWLHRYNSGIATSDSNAYCRGFEIFSRRAPSVRSPNDVSWQTFLTPGFALCPDGAGTPAQEKNAAGPTLSVQEQRRSAGNVTYEVELGFVAGPLMGDGGVLTVTVTDDGTVECHDGGERWLS